MEDNKDFKKIWKKQNIVPMSEKDLFEKLKHFRNSNLRKMLGTIISLLVICLFIIFVWVYFSIELLTTKIGIVLCLVAMIMYILSIKKIYQIYKNIDNFQKNSDYIQKLLVLKLNEKNFHTTICNLYFLLLTTGICLYLYEFALKMTLEWGIICYSIVLGWIGFNWFYFRPRIIKKQTKKLDDMIKKIEFIQQQLTEEN